MPVQKSKLVIILRGLPGTGKTYIANEYLSHIGDVFDPRPEVPILSSDDFFIKEGVFHFDKDKLGEAHKWNFERFKEEIGKETPFIIVDNTNIKNFHYYHYLDYAQRNNYLVLITIVPDNNKSNRELSTLNIHGVTQETIRRMRSSFEWKTEEK